MAPILNSHGTVFDDFPWSDIETRLIWTLGVQNSAV